MAEGSSPITEKAIMELEEYFSGNRFQFDIPLLFIGTEFQKIVWNKLLTIRYGYTLSYGEMARQLGCYKSARAVANAIGANAISIFTPCHRVIGSTPTREDTEAEWRQKVAAGYGRQKPPQNTIRNQSQQQSSLIILRGPSGRRYSW